MVEIAREENLHHHPPHLLHLHQKAAMIEGIGEIERRIIKIVGVTVERE
jgi:hypothetical protein